MSLLADTTSMLPGCLVASIYPGLGAPAAAIIAASSGGESGPGPLVGLGLVDGTDYYWTITSQPASGTLTIYEDGSFSHAGAADGSWPWSANVYADGVLAYALTVTDGFGVVVGLTLQAQIDALQVQVSTLSEQVASLNDRYAKLRADIFWPDVNHQKNQSDQGNAAVLAFVGGFLGQQIQPSKRH